MRRQAAGKRKRDAQPGGAAAEEEPLLPQSEGGGGDKISSSSDDDSSGDDVLASAAGAAAKHRNYLTAADGAEYFCVYTDCWRHPAIGADFWPEGQPAQSKIGQPLFNILPLALPSDPANEEQVAATAAPPRPAPPQPAAPAAPTQPAVAANSIAPAGTAQKTDRDLADCFSLIDTVEATVAQFIKCLKGIKDLCTGTTYELFVQMCDGHEYPSWYTCMPIPGPLHLFMRTEEHTIAHLGNFMLVHGADGTGGSQADIVQLFRDHNIGAKWAVNPLTKEKRPKLKVSTKSGPVLKRVAKFSAPL